MNIRFTPIILLLSILISCSKNTEQEKAQSNSSKSEYIEDKIVLDTLNSSFPIQIGNNKGSVKIVGLRTFENQILTSSNFIISINGISDYTFSRQIDKTVLIDSNKTVYFNDTINSDYLDYAIIKNVDFNFVRGNTLYFNAILENQVSGKEIAGRFNLFYSTKKRGTVYGWITDDVKEVIRDKEYR